MNEYGGAFVIKSPCSLSTPTFTLPTIESKKLSFTDTPVQVLPIKDLVINNSNTTFPTSDLDAVQKDIDMLHNLTAFHTISLKDISDTGILGQYDIFHGTNLVIITILAVIIGTFAYLAERRPKLLFRCCPFLFSSPFPNRPNTPTFQTQRPHWSHDEEEVITMSQLREETVQTEGPVASESDPLGPTQAEAIATPGTSEGAAYATVRAPSAHYKTLTRVLPVTPPHNLKRGVQLVLPAVRYTGEDPVYSPSSERRLLDEELYIIST